MEKIVSKKTVREVEKYTYFNPKLKDASYATGDVYGKEHVANMQSEWDIHSDPQEKPYLAHVKALSATWPHLRLLADFMEVSTSPVRWNDLKGKQEKRDERAARTNVARIDYPVSGKGLPVLERYSNSVDLKVALHKEAEENDADQREFRLYVVEDLSRDVIELLGAHLDIEPAFFREHIFNFAWYNTRDRWMDPPQLSTIIRRQRWLQLRFATARYFTTTASFTRGCKEAEEFNVLRRPEDDLNNKALWDEQGAIVGLSRTRASFWSRRAEGDAGGAVGVLLVDPTIKEGVPLWYGYRNWDETPSMHEKKTSFGPPRDSLYSDLVFWLQKVNAFQPSPRTTSAFTSSDSASTQSASTQSASSQPDSTNPALPSFPSTQSTANQSTPTRSTPTQSNSNVHIPIQALLHLVCGEWLTISDYIRTRLGQIEWEISFPEHFLNKGSNIDVALKKLHIWRRLVPLYREMLTENLQRLSQFPCGTATPTSSSNDGPHQPNHSHCTIGNLAPAEPGPIPALREDFARVLSYMEEFQRRIDRLTSVVTAIISIEDSRRSQDDNRNVARLTWLATFFIPLSFVAGLFSIQDDISSLQQSFKWYFATALPLAALSLGLAVVLALPGVQMFGEHTLKKLKTKK